MKEIWKDIEGYEGLYQISSLGEVKSYYTNKVLKQTTTNYGYKRLGLYKNKKIKSFLVHRLLAEAFIPNPLNKPQVNHINSIRNDNNLDNLEWVTEKENSIHGYKYGKMKNYNEYRSAFCKKRFSRKINKYDLNGKFLEQYYSINEAARKNKNNAGNIQKVCVGKSKFAKGYIWKYDEESEVV